MNRAIFWSSHTTRQSLLIARAVRACYTGPRIQQPKPERRQLHTRPTTYHMATRKQRRLKAEYAAAVSRANDLATKHNTELYIVKQYEDHNGKTYQIVNVQALVTVYSYLADDQIVYCTSEPEGI